MKKHIYYVYPITVNVLEKKSIFFNICAHEDHIFFFTKKIVCDK